MTSTSVTERATDLTEHDGEKPVAHAVCTGCFPQPGPDDVAMCGSRPKTLAVHLAPPPDRPLCVVCVELAPKPCERCGQ